MGVYMDNNGNKYSKKFDDLRNKAEEILAGKKGHPKKLTLEIDELIHELQIYQIELEMQNEESPLFDTSGNLIGISTIARDITDRKKAEIALRLSHLYNRSLIEASIDPLVTISPEGKITDVNEATVIVTGVEREKLIDSDFFSYFTDPVKARAGYEQVFKEGKVRDYELEIQNVNGEITPVSYNASVYRDETGQVEGVFAAARDMGDLKEAKRELQKASNYTRSLIEASIDPLVTISPEGKITDVNEATVIVTGVEREKLIGTDFSNYFTDPKKAKTGYQQVFKDNMVRNYDLEIRKVNGDITPVLYNASVYLDDDGEVAGVFAAARDISQLKKAEEVLKEHMDNLEITVKKRTNELTNANVLLNTEIKERKKMGNEITKSEDFLRNIVENIPNMIFVKSADNLNFEMINKADEDLFGHSREEVIGKTDYDFFPKDQADFFTQTDREALQNKKLLDIPEETIETKNLGQIILHTKKIPIFNKEGNPQYILGISEDITERKQAEDALNVKVDELARSNAELEQFAYVSSHDLQEPLRMVSSYMQLLQRRYEGEIDPKADKYINFAVEGATRMQQLINDLLTYSRITTQAKEFEPVDSELVLTEVLSNLNVLITENGAVITHDPLPNILADSSQLSQVLQNLIINSIKFHGDKTPEIHVSAKNEGNKWLFSVQDNGIGIDPAHSDRIFEVFKRLHKRKEYPGTGIGLSICKKIIERHGGRIWVEAELGKGSIFYFTIPVRRV
jgi:PAS domain S-box-containing protein